MSTFIYVYTSTGIWIVYIEGVIVKRVYLFLYSMSFRTVSPSPFDLLCCRLCVYFPTPTVQLKYVEVFS